jgi:3-oxoacyl-[acyl-carrier protein] reductase
MEMNLINKKVLIVGASKGIGRAIALAFAKEGSKIIAVARTESLLLKLKDECIEEGASDFLYQKIDITGKYYLEQIKVLNDKYGPFDVVIHNVGTSLVSRNIFETQAKWYQALNVNALASINMNSILIPSMLDHGIKGHIVHISSISAHYLRGNPLYASSKAFLNAYITTAGRELASKGIVLNGCMPGAVAFEDSYWDRAIKAKDSKVEDFLRHHQAIGRFGTPEEIANLVVFLASDRSSFMPGCVVPIDGGNM